MNVLVVNAGSSSLKLRVLGPADEVLARHDVERWDGRGHFGDLLGDLLDGSPEVHAVGHRVVHGGSRFTGPTLIDEGVRAGLAELVPLAPLHQPRALDGVDAVRELLPDVPHVACFDTAFHASLPEHAATYPLPPEWRERWGLRRYGFHGLSHAYADRRARELAGGGERVVVAHLGAGCSLSAVRGGRSVDTTMGFTPLAGLVMGTRSGDVDPGLLLWLQRRGGLSADEVADGLEHRSGLTGLSGVGGDLRDVRAAAAGGSARARLALEVYEHRLRQGIAAMAASLGGLDLLVFTGGAGENDAALRERVAGGLGFLGVRLDPGRNAGCAPDARISGDGSAVGVWVLAAGEDVEIARQTRSAL
ncbi:acetate/propionate family kinase [Actinosynnema pretiosum subsp. pretiosum]|uniref:Acetate kinase n=1 Tax=Actinosynnema pretiosum subsp. pretiosum TaxID=103721 RepID=A0AA45R5Y3_9PSEU|nr:Acetate kinase [Actinosynnema pretiosum subsp. pretiosum]QUF06452.1 acetate/propionate family kinase [Actinosynnema pretiosum subsp. pretiosum]